MKNLKVRERHAKIISALRQHGSLSITELAALLDVSDERISTGAEWRNFEIAWCAGLAAQYG
jgi:DNA-binding transcriptional regulator YiaG